MIVHAIIYANSANHDGVLRSVAFNLSLHCLPKYAFSGFLFKKDQNILKLYGMIGSYF